MRIEEFHRSFRRAPVYVFCGEEDFLKAEGVAKVRSNLLPEASEPSGYAELDANDVDMATVLDELRTRTLFATERLVVLERADRFFGLTKKRDQDSASEDDADGEGGSGAAGAVKSRRELLVKYLDSPAEFSSLVITTAHNWDRRLKVTKRIEGAGFLVECKRPYENRLPQWLAQRAQQHYQKRLVGRAAGILAVEGGHTLGELDSQLAKLATYVGDRPQITEEDLQEVVGHAGYHVIFKLTDAVAFKKTGEALGILHDLLHHGVSENQIVPMLAWGSRRLWRARKLENAGLSPPQVCKELKVSDFFSSKFLNQVHQFTDSELERNHRLVLDADLASKSGYDPEVVLDQLVVQLCR